MGSCEDSSLIDEPSCDSAIEKQLYVEFRENLVSGHCSCSETGFDGITANVNDIDAVDGCLGLSSYDPTCCMSSDDVLEAGVDNRVGLLGECENVVVVDSEIVADDECGISGVCWNESQSKFGVSNLPGMSSILSPEENNVVGSCNVRETVVVNRDGLMSECENVAGLVLEKSVDDVCGVSLNMRQIKVDVNCSETDGVVKSLEGCEIPSGEMRGNTAWRNHDQQDVQKDDKEVDVLLVEGTSEVIEEKIDVLAQIKVGTGDQTSSFEGCGTPLESISGTAEPKNNVQQREHEDDKIVDCFSGEERVIEEKNDDLARLEKDKCNKVLSSWCPELATMTGTLRNYVQWDEQKDDKRVVSPSLEGVLEVMEQRTDALAGTKKSTCEQRLPSKCNEMVLAGSLRNGVHEEDLENDKNVGCPASEGLMEFMVEKTNTCDQMLPSQGCAMPTESIPKTFSPSNCIDQNEQKADDTVGEVMEGKNDSLTGTEKDVCEQVLSLQDCEIYLESKEVTDSMRGFTGAKRDVLVSSTGLSNNSTQHYQQKETESIGDPSVEEKADEFLSKLSCRDDLLGNCEGHNDQKDHNGFSFQDEEPVEKAAETKSNIDTYILALPVHSCQSSLENFHLADVINYTQQNEHSNNRSVDVPSTESVVKVMEQKSDVTTDVKLELCSQVIPMDESLKEHSSVIVPNRFGEKLVSLYSCLPSGVDENSSCNRVEVTDLLQKDLLFASSSSCAVDGSRQMDHRGKDDERVDCIAKTKFPDIISSYSRRSSRISRSSQKSQTKTVARDSRKTAKVLNQHGIIDIIFKVARQKRSCFSKRARSSIWGLLGNITQIFDKSDDNRFSQVQTQGLQKVRGGKGSRKRSKTRAGGSSVGSSSKNHSSTRCFRLKVKVGNKVCPSSLNVKAPEMFDTAGTYDHIVGDDRTSEFPQSAHVVEDKSGEEKCSDDSVADVHVAKELEGTVMLDKSAADVTGDHLENPTHKGAEILEGAIENNYVNPGTSPDSEVIDVIPEAQVGAKSQEGFDKSVSTSSTAFVTPEYITSSRRGKKKDNLLLGSNSIREDRSTVSARRNKAKPPKKRGGRQKKGDGFLSSDTFSEFSGANVSSNSLSTEEFYVEPLPSLEETDLGIIEEANVPSVKSNECPLSKSSKSDGMKKGRSDVSGSAKSRRKNACNQGGNQRKSVHKSRVKEKSDLVTKGRKRGACNEFQDKTEDHPDIGSQIADDIEKTESGNINASIDVAKMGIISAYVLEQSLPSESAWVRCDECFKWRRIPVALADSIDENCRWVCKDNIDKAFADCSTPQEKSNADINAELGLSDFEEDDCFLNYNGSLDHRSIAGPGSCFRRIDSNAFLHRSRKSQTIDEIMVCHCKPPLDGRLGCGDECLNRMLNIECVQGTCPCGDRCSNQQFQKRKYANMRWSRCGKKGFGLLLNDDISKGQFIIEYVGEVLDMQAYEARQKEYAANGHKHFYFMTLNGSEVIDACAKGNLGRFINHSCDPNCRTEKWMVNGEICIGLFALRDIKKDEELTFDYNYVRVFGAAAKKCHCGSPQCRGYIGGDPQNTEVIYQGDSDEEYPEPLMLEDGESGGVLNNSVSRTSSFSGDRTQYALKDKEKLDDATRVISHLEISAELEDHMNQSASAISEVHSSLEKEESKTKYLSAQPDIQTEVLTSKTLSVLCPEVSMEEETNNNASSFIRQVEMTSSTLMSSKLLLDGIDANRNAKSDTVEDKQCLVKSRPRIKTSRSSGSAKKGKVGSSQQNGNKVKMVPNKSQLLPIKSKKLVESSSNGRFEAVQEKLNELLDADGGISKRKDAPKGYLKLLLLTAASGDSGNGEAIQSNRDLSMILDALLKTKSRMVLLDIINKNGLQMLHNIMKQYRRDFKKIPILRKLLKVLEYLAVREILTRDHIVGGPPCAGMESFRESILSLTEHDDKQVHQIARNFRDKWIPKPVRKSSYMDRDDGRMDFQRGLNCIRLSTSHGHWHDQASRPSEAIDCVMQSLQTSTSADSTANEAGSAPCSDGRQTTGSTTRKRKSRWDQPAEADLDSRSVVHKEQKLDSKLLQQYEKSSSFTTRGQVVINHADMLSREESNCPDCVVNHYNRDEAANSEDGGHITHEDVPPGFSSPHNPPVSSDASSTTDLPQHDVAVGHPQEKFISRLPVSYGIPLHILQQFGPPQAETLDSWVIAPGMPFHPFPPLPPFPRDKKGSSPGCSVSTKTVNEPVGELQQDNIRLPTCHSEENNPSTTGANQSDGDTPCADIQQTCKRTRGSSNDLGRRYFRQQKRKGPPWLWRRNELRGSSWSQDSRVDKPSSNFYQRPSQQNHH